jgi:hypothetical protein
MKKTVNENIEVISRDINSCTISGEVVMVEPFIFENSECDYTFFKLACREYKKKTFVDVSNSRVNLFSCVLHGDGIIVNQNAKVAVGSKVVVNGRLSMLPPYKYGENALYLLVERIVICGYKEEKE